jgi:hypothetical protein
MGRVYRVVWFRTIPDVAGGCHHCCPPPDQCSMSLLPDPHYHRPRLNRACPGRSGRSPIWPCLGLAPVPAVPPVPLVPPVPPVRPVPPAPAPPAPPPPPPTTLRPARSDQGQSQCRPSTSTRACFFMDSYPRRLFMPIDDTVGPFLAIELNRLCSRT